MAKDIGLVNTSALNKTESSLINRIKALKQIASLILEDEQYKQIANSYSPDVAIPDVIVASDELLSEIESRNQIK